MWMGELKSYPRSWTNSQILEITALLLSCNATRPTDIHRKIRTLKLFKHFKGTELRTILMYTGIVIFKDFLSEKEYELFLWLFCAVTICSTQSYKTCLPKARDLLMEFNERHIEVYGEHSMTNNIHLLSHLVDDVEHLGDLSTLSAYPFENALHSIKLLIKPGDHPLQQIARRLHELAVCEKYDFTEEDKFPKLSEQAFLPDGTFKFKKIEYKKKVSLSSLNGKDCWFLDNENSIIQFDCVIVSENGFMIRGSSLKNTEDFFTEPFCSRYLNIFASNLEKNEPKLYEIKNIKAKLFNVPYHQKRVFIPLVHSL